MPRLGKEKVALKPCSECNLRISDKAVSCPHCGAPTKNTAKNDAWAKMSSKEKSEGIAGLIVLGAIVILMVKCSSSGSSESESRATTPKVTAAELKKQSDAEDAKKKKEAADRAEKCAANPLVCAAEKNLALANVMCPPLVERLAKYSVRWTDGMFEQKLDHYRWLDKAKGSISYIGDRVQFQNGFGAYAAMVYECDIGADGTILDVRAQPGRL